MSGTGNGTVLTLDSLDPGISDFTARLLSISGLAEFIDDIDDTALEDAVEKLCAGDVKKTEPIAVEYYAEYGEAPPIGARFTMTVRTSPIAPKVNGATLTATVFVMRRESPDLRNGQRRIGSFTLRCDGATPPAYAAAT